LPDRAARQGQRHAGRKVQSDQQSDIGEADAVLAGQQRRHRGDALELEGDGAANREQNGENTPAIVHPSLPSTCWHNLRRHGTLVNQRTGGDRAAVAIGLASRFTYVSVAHAPTIYPFTEDGIGRTVADAMAMKTVKSTIVPWPELVE
jgi:hypothetical protein